MDVAIDTRKGRKWLSVAQWVCSFVFFDLIVWLLLWWSCISRPIMCKITAIFVASIYYLPFGIFTPSFGIESMGGASPENYFLPITGFLAHCLIGFAVGFFLRNKRFSLESSIAIALLALFSLVVISMAVLRITGQM